MGYPRQKHIKSTSLGTIAHLHEYLLQYSETRWLVDVSVTRVDVHFSHTYRTRIRCDSQQAHRRLYIPREDFVVVNTI